MGSIARILTPYALAYAGNEDRMPMRSELTELTELTRRYLELFMFNEFSQTSFTILDDFITRFVTSAFIMGAPIVVEFNSTARFDPTSAVLPMVSQLDEALVMAFSGENLDSYILLLATLPDGNVFQDTYEVKMVEPTMQVSSRDSSTRGGYKSGIAAGAVAFTLLAAGVMLYKRRAQQDEVEGKSFEKTGGDMTVAGDTYAGDTVSIDASSLDYGYLQRDAEEGTARIHLDPIRENYDDSSVTPAWDGNLAQEENQDDDADESWNGTDSTAQYDVTVSTDYITSSEEQEERSVFSDLVSEVESLEDISLTRSQDSADGDSESHASSLEGEFLSGEREASRPASADEIDSLLSYGVNDELQIERQGSRDSFIKSLGSPSHRPRSVSEIESLLSADLDDDSLHDAVSVQQIAKQPRPRTVSEIESMLSTDLSMNL
jgi:hypothetical protein